MGVAATDLGRRQFLRGDSGARRMPLRPPWALSEERFSSLCTRCAACIDACDQGVIAKGSGGYPEMDYRRRGCTFCGACVPACEPGALGGGVINPNTAWCAVAVVAPACLAVNGVVCRACGDVCEPRAISFRLLPGGRAAARIDPGTCTACGACVALCPVAALRIVAADTAATR